MVPFSFGARGLGIDHRFPPLPEPKVEFTSTIVPDFFVGMKELVQPKGLGIPCREKKK